MAGVRKDMTEKSDEEAAVGVETRNVFLDTEVFRSYGHNLNSETMKVFGGYVADGVFVLYTTDVTLREVSRQLGTMERELTKRANRVVGNTGDRDAVDCRRQPSWSGLGSNGRTVHDTRHHPADALGGGLNVPVADMHVTQRHLHLGVAEQTRHHRQRNALHRCLAGKCVPEVVKAHVFQAGAPSHKLLWTAEVSS